MPRYEESLAYIAVLVLSEFCQDVLVWIVLVQERGMPQRLQMLSEEGRAWLKAKAYPPVFDSWAGFATFLIPILAAGGGTCPFIFASADIFLYELNRTRTLI
jgi:hypothetical protein